MSDPTQGSGSTTGSGDDYGDFKGLLDQLEQQAERAPAAGTREGAAAATADPVQQICDVWPTLRVVLEIVLKLPFIPGRVKDVIRRAIPIFDRICRPVG
jgi:hypothetical protein